MTPGSGLFISGTLAHTNRAIQEPCWKKTSYKKFNEQVKIFSEMIKIRTRLLD